MGWSLSPLGCLLSAAIGPGEQLASSEGAFIVTRRPAFDSRKAPPDGATIVVFLNNNSVTAAATLEKRYGAMDGLMRRCRRLRRRHSRVAAKRKYGHAWRCPSSGPRSARRRWFHVTGADALFTLFAMCSAGGGNKRCTAFDFSATWHEALIPIRGDCRNYLACCATSR
jgi:hypothetical protein